MRAIKSVLVMAGQKKRQLQMKKVDRKKKKGGGSTHISQEEESHILIHSLRDANLPKFLAEDVPLFQSIMADLFPGIKPPQQATEALEKAISMSVRDQGLQLWPSQIEKVKQLHNQILVRHGVMLVGPTGGGKTTIRNILQRALVLLPTITIDEDKIDQRKTNVFLHNRSKKGHVETFTVNPKCVKLGELYGETDPNTFEWSDGLIATATRRFARDLSQQPLAEDISNISLRPSTVSSATSGSRPTTPAAETPTGDPDPPDGRGPTEPEASAQEASIDSIPTNWRWIILDGPVDTLWVENLNTVLDDSKILCLANGERISLIHGMRLLFEVDDLSRASPATISRCAMVYMDPVDLGWKPYIKTWLHRLPREIPDSGKHHLGKMFDHAMPRGFKFLKQYFKHLMLPTPDMSIVMCLCNIMSAFLDFMSKNGGFGSPDKELQRPPSAESESSHSRSSSRTGSRSSSRNERRYKKAGKKQKKEELKSISEKKSKAKAADTGKQYYLQRNPSNLPVLLGKLFVFSFTWSFGGNFKRQDEIDDDGGIRSKGSDHRDLSETDIATEFDNFVREVFEVEPPLGVRLPASSRTIYSYFVDMDSGNFLPWDALVPTTQSLIEKGSVITIGETMGVSGDGRSQKSSQDVDIVTTVDTVRYAFLSSLLLLNKNSVLLTGESGVGKTAIIKYLLKRLEKEGGLSYKSGTILGSVFNFTDKNKALLDNISSLTKLTTDQDDEDHSFDLLLGGPTKPKVVMGIASSMLQFSAQTTAARTQQALTHKLIKKGRDTLGAPKGKKILVFVDDFNMPAQEEFGAQPPLELLRQFMDMGGFYDTKKLIWKDILDVTLIAACGPPGGGRNAVSPRLLKHFCMLALPQPSTRSLQHIYQVQLGRYFQENEFMPEVKECLFSLVSASIAVYYRMCSNMRPTPAKIHYTFNIRDLSQVVTGLLQADEAVIVNSDLCAQLFAHEATRVFHDRLVDLTDRTLFYEMLSDNLHDYFKVKWTAEYLMEKPTLFADFLALGEASSKRQYKPINDYNKLTVTLDELYMRQIAGNTLAPQLVFFKDAVEHILRAARVFRQPGGHMLLVGLDGTGKSTTVQLAAYVANCELFKLTLSRTYGLQDFRDDIKKVCCIAGAKGLNTVFLLTDADIVKESFLEDINCILNSGEVPDLFDNEEIDSIAMDLKMAAAEAQVPDTRLAVYQFFIQRVKMNLHIVMAMSPVGNKFRQRCRMNPSLINCSTIDWYAEWDKDAMLAVAQVYFQHADFIAEEGYDLDELKLKVAQVCVDIHGSVRVAAEEFRQKLRRYYYVTPSNYIDLIRIYSSMLKAQKQEFVNNRQRLLNGLAQLAEANSLVGTMQEELVALGPKIEEKAKDTELLLEQLEKDQEAVDQVREIVVSEETVMKAETEIVQNYADECQSDLASVIPDLQEAMEDLDQLDNKADISEIRVYVSPPLMVRMVMGAVCILLGKKPDWATAKQILADPLFIKKLLNFDKNSASEKVFAKIKKYSSHPDFTPDKVGQVSKACRSMCQWVLALENYHEVYKMAKPKQKKLEDAREALALARQNLAQKQASLCKIQEHLQLLQQQYQDSVNQRESLKERKKLTALRLERASVLISALSGEKVRWNDSVIVLDTKLKGLVGDIVVCAGGVAYLGAFTTQFRHSLLDQWAQRCRDMHIPLAPSCSFVRSMVDANQVLHWQNEGLPHDTASTENAIIMKKAHKYPLLFDPEGQASSWLHQMEGTNMKVAKASDPNYMRTLERAIRVGEAVLLQEVTEQLDPSLKPILAQDTFVRGGNHVMKLGDTEIEYNSNFRLYMTTNLSNPHYLPSVCIQVNLINFSVNFEGLQEQLLSCVVKQERPQLELERNHLLESISSDNQLLRDLEDKTLSLLQKTEGHILDDQDLMDTLQQSKGMSSEITCRVEQSEVAEKKLNLARHKYLPVATRGATLYFLLAHLGNVDVMYQFSLNWFQNMFSSCIDLNTTRPLSTASHTHAMSGTLRRSSSMSQQRVASTTSSSHEGNLHAAPPVNLKEHMQKMINRLTSNIYRIVSVALFAKHKLMFSFLMCSSIMRNNADYPDAVEEDHIGGISQLEWQIFLQANIMASTVDANKLRELDGLSPLQRLETEARPDSAPRRLWWVTDTMWQQCQLLEAMLPTFSQLTRSLMSNHAQWTAISAHDDPYHLMEHKYQPQSSDDGESKKDAPKVVFPWEQLTNFQRVLLLRVVRPGAVIAAAHSFIEEQMGAEFVNMGTIDLKEMFEESNAKTPLIFILSPGSDPATLLQRFAKDLRGSTLHLEMISLGRGQGPKAEDLISKAQILKGRWIFLQNCHLAASWMPRLQNLVENYSRPNTDIDPQFRLWLSSKPDPSFPVSILQNGLKMTVEPPRGVRAKLLRTFGAGGMSERQYEETCPGKPAWKNLLFGLCFFNAVIHERKKYGRLGWNIPYEFNDSDLEVSILQLQMLLMEQEELPWPALWYLTGEVTYGGRVTDDWDRRCLHSLVQVFYNPAALDIGYYYSTDKIYHPVPQDFSFTDVKTYIEQLPTHDTPELFGMDANAEKACLEQQSMELINTLLGVQPKLTKELIGGKTKEELVLELAAEMLRSIPEKADPEHDTDAKPGQMHHLTLGDIVKISTGTDLKAYKKRKSEEQTAPSAAVSNKQKETVVTDAEKEAIAQVQKITQSALFTVLRQEVDRFNNLLGLIHKSLRSLSLAVKGEIVMSEHLEEAYDALLHQRVPQQWKIASYESTKPLGPWVKDLISRVDFFCAWAEKAATTAERVVKPATIPTQPQGPQQHQQQEEKPTVEMKHIQPRSFWLPAFFFPQGFLTAVLQNHARKMGVSVDSLTFKFEVKLTPDENSETLNDIKHKLDVKNTGFKGNTAPDSGVLVFGLFIDGATWDLESKRLTDSRSGQRFARLPEIHFIPTLEGARASSTSLESPLTMFRTRDEDSNEPEMYDSPLYRTSTRAGTLSSTGHSTNFVTSVQMPSLQKAEMWIMRGVALLCQLDD